MYAFLGGCSFNPIPYLLLPTSHPSPGLLGMARLHFLPQLSRAINSAQPQVCFGPAHRLGVAAETPGPGEREAGEREGLGESQA